MPVQTWLCKARQARTSLVPRLLLWVWLGGSLVWVANWARFFYLYCDLGPTFACVLGGFLQTVFYSLPEVLKLVFGPPALALFLGFAVYRLVKVRRRLVSRARSEAEEADALGNN